MDVDENEWYKEYLSVRRNVWRNRKGNQKTYIEEDNARQWLTLSPNRILSQQ
jgi:hypothetical protein